MNPRSAPLSPADQSWGRHGWCMMHDERGSDEHGCWSTSNHHCYHHESWVSSSSRMLRSPQSCIIVLVLVLGISRSTSITAYYYSNSSSTTSGIILLLLLLLLRLVIMDVELQLKLTWFILAMKWYCIHYYYTIIYCIYLKHANTKY
jgi:hypothetical protein